MMRGEGEKKERREEWEEGEGEGEGEEEGGNDILPRKSGLGDEGLKENLYL